MIRRYVLLGAFCLSLMFGLAQRSAIVHPLWRLSFVPEDAARQQRPTHRFAATVSVKDTSASRGDATYNQK